MNLLHIFAMVSFMQGFPMRFAPGWLAPGWLAPVMAVVLSAAAAAPLAGQVTSDEFADRRAALVAAVGDGVILAMGSAAPPQDYIPFHQNSLFRYLTGFTEPDAALIMVAAGDELHEILFVNPRDPGRETWEGIRMGPERSVEATGIPGRSVADLSSVVDSLLAHQQELRVVGPYQPAGVVQNDVTQRVRLLVEGHDGVSVRTINSEVNALRALKSDAELELLRRTVAITVEAHREVAAHLAPGRNEFEIQAVLEMTFRRYGSERPAFASIVGSGPNSTILHYNTNDRFMEDGDMVVVDIGASYGGYAADVTRSYPVNGRFSPEQRAIYQLVRDAQAAAEDMAGPGAAMGAMNAEASRILAAGLAELGLIEAPDATYETAMGTRAPQLQLYYMHGLGHGIGLDVHDPAPSPLEAGAVISIEPGLYVRPNLLTEVVADTPANRAMIEGIRPAFERFVGIGVRIEDNYIITRDGVEWISPAPREIDEIEAALAAPRAGADRNAEWVEWYRRMR
ncbi:MAG: M24 family metallopeptidase [Gemmatimonadales bacterium]|nr:MAG: M24 family metallopeptidase [Gemmatimonadales bacterium]